MKRVYLIHGWEGNSQNNWFPWLKRNLEENGFDVFVPDMPGTDTPVKDVWLKTMQDLISKPDNDTYLIGHSMGCQAIQRYLESLPDDVLIGGAVLVAGWINDPMWEGRTEEETEVIHDWFDAQKDYEKIKSHCSKFISIYSSDDPFILKPNWEEAEKELGSKVLVLESRGHFSDDDNAKELPEVLSSILEISE